MEYNPEDAGRCQYGRNGTATPDTAAHKEIVEIVMQAIGSMPEKDEERADLLRELFQHKPLYDPDNWVQMEEKLIALGSEGAAQEEARAREDRALGFKDDAEGRRMANLAREVRENEERIDAMPEFNDFM